jgi:hypothetical protein
MATVKKKCCRSKPKRCKSCPVVHLRLKKIDVRGLSDKEYRRAVKAARIY